ncbi:hypothetical protein FOL47_001219 [Perkinsus chesapeaki]|uniref:Uncharacterized protein n=1 Tax=Perkinsus chesapeaki TaxID=330153 RepID=A0A7J6MJQ7_PERCH|nr:hypothetical protein FOL47_001219 [Perkinsus chesapeaki]
MAPLSREATYSGITRWYSADVPCRGNNQGEWLPKPPRGLLHCSASGLFNGVKETINPIGVSKGHWFLLPPAKAPSPGPVFGPVPPRPQPHRSLWRNSLQPLEPFKTPRSLARSGSCLSYFGRRTEGHLNPETMARSTQRPGGLSTWKSSRSTPLRAMLFMVVAARRGLCTTRRVAAVVLSRHGARTPTSLSSYPGGEDQYPWKGILPPGGLTSLGKAQMVTMGHRYSHLFGDVIGDEVEIISSKKARALESANAMAEGFWDRQKGTSLVRVDNEVLSSSDAERVKELMDEKDKTDEYMRKAHGEWKHLLEAFGVNRVTKLRKVGSLVLCHRAHDLPPPYSGRAAELVDEAMVARDWIMRTRYEGFKIGRVAGGRLLQWLINAYFNKPKGLTILSGHDANLFALQSFPHQQAAKCIYCHIGYIFSPFINAKLSMRHFAFRFVPQAARPYAFLCAVLGVGRHKIFVPNFADSLAMELWVEEVSGRPPTSWVTFERHCYKTLECPHFKNQSDAFARGAGAKQALTDPQDVPKSLAKRFGEDNVIALVDLSRYEKLVMSSPVHQAV